MKRGWRSFEKRLKVLEKGIYGLIIFGFTARNCRKLIKGALERPKIKKRPKLSLINIIRSGIAVFNVKD